MASEIKWQTPDMPLTYESAPTLVNNDGDSDCVQVLELLNDVKRTTPVGKFSSKFRSRLKPLPPEVGKEIIKVYERFRTGGAEVCKSYMEAMPYPPPCVDRDRAGTYCQLLKDVS